MNDILRELRSKVVRDLVWSVASPNLLCAEHRREEISAMPDDVGLRLAGASMAWLRGLDADSQGLVAFLRSRRNAQRLGFYMSALLEFFVQECPALATRKLVASQQLVRNGEVVGSLKFVFFCAPTDLGVRRALRLDPPGVAEVPGRPALCHWEASIKFFVHVRGPGDPLARYVGPFLHENLASRVETCGRKMALSRETSVRRWASRELAGDQDPHRVRRLSAMCALRGYLFYRGDAVETPEALAKDHGRGFWARSIDDCPRATRWVVLPKPHWLAPCRAELDGEGSWIVSAPPEAGGCLEVLPDLEAVVDLGVDTPVMLAALEPHDGSSLVETRRGFLLPGDWDSLKLRPKKRGGGGAAATASRRNTDEDDGGENTSGSCCAIATPSSTVEVDVEEAAESPQDLLRRLDGRRHDHDKKGRKVRDAKALAKRAAALLAATEEDAASRCDLALRCVRCLLEHGGYPRAVAARLGDALVAAVDEPPGVSEEEEEEEEEEKEELAERLFHDVVDGRLRGGLSFDVALKCARRFAPRAISALSAIDRLERALEGDDKQRVVVAAKLLLATAGERPRVPSRLLARCVRRLAREGAIDVAEKLVACPDDDDGGGASLASYDVQAARALVDECVALGHATKAKKLEKSYFRGLPPEDDVPGVLIRSDALDLSADGFLRLAVPVHVVSTFPTRLLLLRDHSVVAIDVEWPPFDASAPASLLQLATSEEVFLFDLPAMNDKATLAEYLRSKTTVFGFGLDTDIGKLRASYPEFADLDGSLKVVDLKRRSSLAVLAQQTLGARLRKDEQCSDWGRRPLTESQIHYAALDAFVLLAIASTIRVFDYPCIVDGVPEIVDPSSTTTTTIVAAKTLAFVGKDRSWLRVLAVLPVDARLDIAKLAAVVGADVRLAAQDELLPRFGFERGSVGPLGPQAPTVFDDSLRTATVACGCGQPGRQAVFLADDFVAGRLKSGRESFGSRNSSSQSCIREAWMAVERGLVAAVEACVAACSACARAAEAWQALCDERSLAYFAAEEAAVASSGGSPTTTLVEHEETSFGDTWSTASSSPPSSNKENEDQRWAKFPAAGLVPATTTTSPRTRARASSRLPDGWLELAAPDGWPIYVNPTLATTSWTRPELPRSTERFCGRVVNVQSHYAFVRTDPPILPRPDSARSAKHAKRVGDIFVYRADVDFELKARQQVTFQLAEYKGRVKAVQVRLQTDLPSPAN
ncbi:hypothetical protein CTAYLR_004459 [Chrysophaeum taylorii]|uniref:WW domain-containing protein n=1 Tax=Chrysophaeum taylorii TaxID=2483200 RepID=A0AAD7XJR9_9STRA|nr:hypothetical protein CTAYLR_004459 [Chrysophaeum taylorii]